MDIEFENEKTPTMLQEMINALTKWYKNEIESNSITMSLEQEVNESFRSGFGIYPEEVLDKNFNISDLTDDLMSVIYDHIIFSVHFDNNIDEKDTVEERIEKVFADPVLENLRQETHKTLLSAYVKTSNEDEFHNDETGTFRNVPSSPYFFT